MTDAELTRLAFKAAFSGADINDHKDMLKRWSPLTDDGDALRLAVKLTMTVKSFPAGARVRFQNEILDTCEVQVLEDEPYAATRRAIVRAAAEIGLPHNTEAKGDNK